MARRATPRLNLPLSPNPFGGLAASWLLPLLETALGGEPGVDQQLALAEQGRHAEARDRGCQVWVQFFVLAPTVEGPFSFSRPDPGYITFMIFL